jgi:histidine triad (HIT) family protein
MGGPVEKCPFCRILAGELEGTFVFQDQICSAIMDIQPINPGHLLVIPNDHHQDLQELPPETGKHIFKVAQRLAAALRDSGVKCEGINIFIADGKVAFQDVFHFHLHIIPRYTDDGFGLQFSPRYAELPTRDELEKNAFYIKQAIENNN